MPLDVGYGLLARLEMIIFEEIILACKRVAVHRLSAPVNHVGFESDTHRFGHFTLSWIRTPGFPLTHVCLHAYFSAGVNHSTGFQKNLIDIDSILGIATQGFIDFIRVFFDIFNYFIFIITQKNLIEDVGFRCMANPQRGDRRHFALWIFIMRFTNFFGVISIHNEKSDCHKQSNCQGRRN